MNRKFTAQYTGRPVPRWYLYAILVGCAVAAIAPFVTWIVTGDGKQAAGLLTGIIITPVAAYAVVMLIADKQAREDIVNGAEDLLKDGSER